MNDGDSLLGRSLLVHPPTPTTSNPWSDLTPSSNNLQSSQSSFNSLLVPSTTAIRAQSAATGAAELPTTGTARLIGNGAVHSTGNGEQTFSSSLRPRPRLRRLRSDLALHNQDAADVPNDQIYGSIPITPSISPERRGYVTSNGSTASLGTSRGVDVDRNRQNSRDASTRSTTPITETSIRRKSSRELSSSHVASSSGELDWDEDDKTREGKARKQAKSTRRTALPSPFSFSLSSGFGSKLLEDVETLWNKTLSPAATYDVRMNGDHGGHAYLDVWGQPVATPSFEEPEGSRGRERRVAGDQRRTAGKSGGPLVERDDIYTSTTPALSRKTTDSVRQHDRSRNLISGEGVDILDSESLTADKPPARNSGETEVFEHIVHPADSLAGVALKYGVTMAQLRKCNKMWASDTIHLRKVLYIPVTSIGISGKKSLPTSGELIDLTNNMSQANLSSERLSQTERLGESNHTSHHSSQPAPYIDPSPPRFTQTLSESASISSLAPSKSVSSTPSVKRVPISELSYFPPPSVPSTTIFTSNPHPSIISAARLPMLNGPSSTLFGSISTSTASSVAPGSQPSSRGASPSRNNNNNGLASSIFQVFPSLNDLNLSNITSRVSFETVRSTGSLPGSGNVSGEEDVELDEMKRRTASDGPGGPLPRGIKKRIRIRPGKVAGEVTAPKERQEKGRIITEQLAPRSMELPRIPAASTSSIESYGSGWTNFNA